MNTQATDMGGKGGNEASTTIGVGGVTSGQSGATPRHETQRETGGSGGEPLTKDDGAGSAAPAAGSAKGAAPAAPAGSSSDAADSSMQSRSRGAFDTRPDQGGGTGTGIGSPESGANQSDSDLPPRAP